ncbi:virulence factor SrfC family protein [Acerihabitans sp. KWT182]|uniref:Virulence factor SrfC family protein n=1 Tax=Acerihabitans sp. KWT182 TaxID=3157919 RepID=A0AAU7Q4H2_9GAMM
MQLRRARNQAKAWREGAAEAPAVGFFGRAQAGKTRLISALTSGENPALTVSLAGENLDYAAHINPDHQSAGLAIRFSRRAVVEDADFPIQLSLLGEVDILRILALAFLLDCRHDGIRPAADDKEIANRLRALALQRQSEPVAGIDGDDVVELWDFLTRHDKHGQQPLAAQFWPGALALCPYLAIDDRARLFSLLWGDVPALTEAYRRFAHALSLLDGARKVLAPRAVLMDDTGLPADALLDAMAFAAAGTSADPAVSVRPLVEGDAASPVALSLAELNFIAAELSLSLARSDVENLSRLADMVDFPGYGGGLDAGRPETLLPAGSSLAPFADAIARAKSLCLLERYAEHGQNPLLLVCTAAQAPSEAKSVGLSLKYWVKLTQGENSRLRGAHKPGLIWALSEYDPRSTQTRHCDDAVQRYVGRPGDSWGTVLVTDDRGISRMAGHLKAEIDANLRQDHIAESLRRMRWELGQCFAGWYNALEPDDEKHKEHIAEILLKTLQARAGVHGELLEHLLPERSVFNQLFFAASR